MRATAPVGAAFLGLVMAQKSLVGGAEAAELEAGQGTVDQILVQDPLLTGKAATLAVGSATGAGAMTGDAQASGGASRLDYMPSGETPLGGLAEPSQGTGSIAQAPTAPATTAAGSGVALPREPQLHAGSGETSLTVGGDIVLPEYTLAESAGGAYADEDLGPIGDTVTGSAGDDMLEGTPDNDTIRACDGDDTVKAGGGDDTVFGEEGDDQLFGEGGDDLLSGGTGDDLLDGGGGSDKLEGDDGDDTLLGNVGDDDLDGGAGDDILDGGAGSDRLFGNLGNDRLIVDSWRDAAREEIWQQGEDTLIVSEGFAASIREDFGFLSPKGLTTFTIGTDFQKHIPADVEAFRQQVHSGIESLGLEGKADHDILADDRINTLIGNDGDNVIYARGGDDYLAGGLGDDVLHGEDGDDRFDLADGFDVAYGGAGDDTFLLGLAEQATIFDSEGSNLIGFARAPTGAVAARLDGEDLLISHDGADVGRIDGYVGNEAAFAGIDTGAGIETIASVMANGASAATASSDILEDFLDDEGQAGGPPAAGDDLLSSFMDPADPEGARGDLGGTPAGAPPMSSNAGEATTVLAGLSDEIFAGDPVELYEDHAHSSKNQELVDKG